MAADTSSVFSQVIQEHLELKRRNAELERSMPLDRYMPDDPFQNHPLFKTEEQARLEETMGGAEARILAPAEPTVLRWPGEDSVDFVPRAGADEDSALWSRSRDFDWGD